MTSLSIYTFISRHLRNPVEKLIISDYVNLKISVIGRWAGLKSTSAFMQKALTNYSQNNMTVT